MSDELMECGHKKFRRDSILVCLDCDAALRSANEALRQQVEALAKYQAGARERHLADIDRIEALRKERDKIAADFGTYQAAIQREKVDGPYALAVELRNKAEALEKERDEARGQLVGAQNTISVLDGHLKEKSSALSALQEQLVLEQKAASRAEDDAKALAREKAALQERLDAIDRAFRRNPNEG